VKSVAVTKSIVVAEPAAKRVNAATAETAMHHPGTVKDAAVITAAAAVTTASQCRRRLNQTDRGHRKQSHHPFTLHASLH
jgi:hypothetical protein